MVMDSKEDEAEIVNQIDEMLNEIGGRDILKVTDVFTFSDPSKIGVIEFVSEAAKIGFWKKKKDKDFMWLTLDDMWFTNNRTPEERIKDKVLGMIKHHLIETLKINKDDVKIIWAKGKRSLEVKRKQVAKEQDNGTVEFPEDAAQIQKEVEHSADQLCIKRVLQRV